MKCSTPVIITIATRSSIFWNTLVTKVNSKVPTEGRMHRK